MAYIEKEKRKKKKEEREKREKREAALVVVPLNSILEQEDKFNEITTLWLIFVECEVC